MTDTKKNAPGSSRLSCMPSPRAGSTASRPPRRQAFSRLRPILRSRPRAQAVWRGRWPPHRLGRFRGVQPHGDAVGLDRRGHDSPALAGSRRHIRAQLVGHSAWGRCVAFSPDGALLASAGDETIARYSSGRWPPAKNPYTHRPYRSGDGGGVQPRRETDRLCRFDHTVRLWETGTCMPARTLTGHTEGVWAVAFSADGSLLASASDDHTVRVWQVATGAGCLHAYWPYRVHAARCIQP